MIGTHEFGGASWMWFVPSCVAVAVVCGWGPTRWRYQLDVAGAHVHGGDSLMRLVPTCVALAIGCDWYPRVWW